MATGYKSVNIKITQKPYKDMFMETKVYDKTVKWVVSEEFINALVKELDRQDNKDLDWCVTRTFKPDSSSSNAEDLLI